MTQVYSTTEIKDIAKANNIQATDKVVQVVQMMNALDEELKAMGKAAAASGKARLSRSFFDKLALITCHDQAQADRIAGTLEGYYLTGYTN